MPLKCTPASRWVVGPWDGTLLIAVPDWGECRGGMLDTCPEPEVAGEQVQERDLASRASPP